MLVTGSELEVQVGSRAGSSHPWMLQGSGGEFNSSCGMARTGATCSSFSAMPAWGAGKTGLRESASAFVLLSRSVDDMNSSHASPIHFVPPPSMFPCWVL